VTPGFFRRELRLAADSLLLLSNAEVCDLIWMSSAPVFSNPSTLAIPEGAAELSRLMTSVSRSQHFSPLLRGDKLFYVVPFAGNHSIFESLIRICPAGTRIWQVER
jgi:hypothetical protein